MALVKTTTIGNDVSVVVMKDGRLGFPWQIAIRFREDYYLEKNMCQTMTGEWRRLAFLRPDSNLRIDRETVLGRKLGYN